MLGKKGLKMLKNNLAGNTLHLIITGAIGFAFFVIGQILYLTLTEGMWQPIGIALYFLLFGIIEFVAMFVLNQVRRDYSYWKRHGKTETYRGSYKRGALCLVALFVLAGVFEFLYELGGNDFEEPSSYIFVIDDSGSMSSNDPNQQREAAVAAIMQNRSDSLPYAVYGFTSDAELLKDMAPYEGADAYSFDSSGGTDILRAIETVVDDIASGKIKAGNAPRIMLLSDGESSGFGWRSVARKARENGAVISSIGFGYSSNLLKDLAEKTGGVFVQVDDVDDLPVQMATAITTLAKRNLISSRVVPSFDLLYAILRVVFLCCLGLVWSWMKYETYCSAAGAEVNDKVLKSSIALCVISSILVELLFQVTDASPILVRMAFCIMWAITPGFFAADKNAEFNPVYSIASDGSVADEKGEKNISASVTRSTPILRLEQVAGEKSETEAGKLGGAGGFGDGGAYQSFGGSGFGDDGFGESDGFGDSASFGGTDGFSEDAFGKSEGSRSGDFGFDEGEDDFGAWK